MWPTGEPGKRSRWNTRDVCEWGAVRDRCNSSDGLKRTMAILRDCRIMFRRQQRQPVTKTEFHRWVFLEADSLRDIDGMVHWLSHHGIVDLLSSISIDNGMYSTQFSWKGTVDKWERFEANVRVRSQKGCE